MTPPAYADNISEPSGGCTRHHTLTKTCPYPHLSGGMGSTRPSPRVISNELFRQVWFSLKTLQSWTWFINETILSPKKQYWGPSNVHFWHWIGGKGGAETKVSSVSIFVSMIVFLFKSFQTVLNNTLWSLKHYFSNLALF